MLDFYTEVFDVAHGASDGPSDVLIVGPDWRGKAPADARVVRSRTNDVWLLGRTFVNGPEDLAAAQEFQKGFHLSGPEGTPVVPPGTDCTKLPAPQNIASAGVGFFDELDAGLKADPPTKDEAEQLRPLYGLGVNPGDDPEQITDPAILRGLALAVVDGEAQILARSRIREQQANGWSWSLGHGIWGTDYLRRAAIAMVGLAALPATEALYYRAASDSTGAPLTGATPYRLHLPADALPPAGENAFWSITMYDLNTRFLVDNPIYRYAINSVTPGLTRNDDGSLDIYLQHAAPAGHESNWLPAPEGRFYAILRVYRPLPQALDGTWVPPALIVGG